MNKTLKLSMTLGIAGLATLSGLSHAQTPSESDIQYLHTIYCGSAEEVSQEILKHASKPDLKALGGKEKAREILIDAMLNPTKPTPKGASAEEQEARQGAREMLETRKPIHAFLANPKKAVEEAAQDDSAGSFGALMLLGMVGEVAPLMESRGCMDVDGTPVKGENGKALTKAQLNAAITFAKETIKEIQKEMSKD